jgi:exosortase family protein XrtF
MHAQKPLLLFLAKALLLYVAWNVLYYEWIVPHTALEEKMTSGIAVSSAALLKVWGYVAEAKHYYDPDGAYRHSEVLVNHQPGILIANPCNGLSLMVLFAGFIIAYPGNRKLKTGYILAGLMLVYSINLIRIQLLILNYLYSKQSFEFNHKYTYTIVVYVCILMLWLYWANRFGSRRQFSPQQAR